jgi:hypothetical protein
MTLVPGRGEKKKNRHSLFGLCRFEKRIAVMSA